MRKIAPVLFAFLALAYANEALADRRVALVIGNATYQNAPRLSNPLKDAEAVSRMLRDAQFDVVESVRNADNLEMRRALREFSDRSHNADMAVVYFAGHGIEVDGQNYLLPTDAALQRDRDIFDEAISLERILQTIEPAKQLRLVILDACRENPFTQRMQRVSALRSLNRGLIAVEPATANTLIAYAAKGGSTAEDGNGENSPFATALVRHLPTPGLDLRQAFGRVRDDVMKATDNKQEPFVYGSLGGSTVSLVRTASLTAPPAQVSVSPDAAASNPQAELRRDYEYAERVGTRQGWESFLKAHPNGFYADLARAQMNKLAAEQASLEASEQARKAAAEKARLAKEGAAPADQAKADAAAKAARKAKADAERARKREQDRLAKAERQKRREDARLRAQSNAVAVPARGNAAAGAKAVAGGLNGGSLYARCDALVPRSDPRDEQQTRPARIEHCMANGGRW